MITKRLDNVTLTSILHGKFTNSDLNGIIYLDIRNDREDERNIINDCLETLNKKNFNNMKYSKRNFNSQQFEYKIGEIYAAIYCPDKSFYRARVLKSLNERKVIVNFIDFGNSEIISEFDLAPLPTSVKILEPLVLVCAIPDILITDGRAFTDVIAKVCQSEVNVRIEGRCLVSELLSSSNDAAIDGVMHLISFEYLNEPIRSYLINNGIAVSREQNYQLTQDHSLSSEAASDIVECKQYDAPYVHETNDPIVATVAEELSTTVLIIHVNAGQELFVQEVTKDVRRKLEYLQKLISNLVHQYRGSTINDNFFNKHNVYLTQYDVDKRWYRTKILKFNIEAGFLVRYFDFGNEEYKESLSDMILLSSDMGEDARILINEPPVARKCRLSSTIISVFPMRTNIRKYFLKRFVKPMKKVTIKYRVKEDYEVVWLITNLLYHDKDIIDLVRLHYLTPEMVATNHSHADSGGSPVANGKVAEYLMHGCDVANEPLIDIGASNDRACLVTYFGSLDEVWVDEGDGQAREMLTNLLAVMAVVPVTDPRIDGTYGVKDDCGVYRGRLVSHDNDVVTVRLIDIGTVTTVHIDALCSLTSAITALPPLASRFQFQSQLRMCPVEESVVHELRSALKNQPARLVRECPGSSVLVDMVVENCSIVQTLMSANIVTIAIPDNDAWFKPNSRPSKAIQVQMTQRNVCHDLGLYSKSL